MGNNKMTPKTILITGASSGLGAALALTYAAPGITLFLTGRNTLALENLAQQCKEKGAAAYHRSIEVTDQEALTEWIRTMDDMVPVDLVIANAGITVGTGGEGDDHADAKKLFDVNVNGVLNTIHPLIPRMVARNQGHIAIISSLASFRALPSAPAYSASKVAVRFYGEALRGILGKSGVAVTVVCPGYVKTPLTDINQYHMPQLMEADDAALLIKKRLVKRPARIAFPCRMYLLMWFLGLLPPQWTEAMFSKLPSTPARKIS